MLGNLNIPNNQLSTQVFYSSSSATTQWQLWNKPMGCTFVYFMVIGGGGAGGSGAGRTGGGGGGGGGASSTITTGFFQSSLLPDILYIQVGIGGKTNGASGTLSYVSVLPNNIAINVLLTSGLSVASGGGSSSSASGGAGGNVGSVFTSTILSNLGVVETVVGQAGGAGGSSVQASSLVPQNIISGGAGGSGYSNIPTYFQGGSISSSGFVSTVIGGTSSVTTGGTGSNGYLSLIPTTNLSNRIPFISTGGAGGGSGGSRGGDGGNGSYGSGGGGGGAGAVTNGSGNGGKGGDGIVIIVCV